MKLNASIRINRPKAGGSVFNPFASITGTSDSIADKSLSFDVNGDADTINKIEAVHQAFREKGYAPVLEVTGGTISAVPEMVSDGGIRRPQTWAGRPVHAIQGDVKFTVVGKVKLPSATPSDTLLADATAILDA